MALTVDGSLLKVRVEAGSASSARATLEDLLACVQVAERTLGLSAKPHSPRRDA